MSTEHVTSPDDSQRYRRLRGLGKALAIGSCGVASANGFIVPLEFVYTIMPHQVALDANHDTVANQLVDALAMVKMTEDHPCWPLYADLQLLNLDQLTLERFDNIKPS